MTRCAHCDRPAASNGRCRAHEMRYRRGDRGDKLARPIKQQRTGCVVDGCDRPHKAHRLCNIHVHRWYRVTGRYRD